MARIHFIVNPISGKGRHSLTASSFRNYFPRSAFQISVDYTRHKSHAVELAQQAVLTRPDYIVACGGDGTINEVASVLVGTTIKLGIIPVGSGNGLAANLGIPKKVEAALDVIKKGHAASIDAGVVNGRYFFSNMGIGIDAMIIKKYERSGRRTLWAYVRAALASSLEFKPRKTTFAYENRVSSSEPFLIFVSNSNEMGYGMSLTPKASLSDGVLDLLIVPKITFFQKLVLGYCVLTHQVDKFRHGKYKQIQQLQLEQPDTIYMDVQIDGEFHSFKTNSIEVSVVKKGLRVLVP